MNDQTALAYLVTLLKSIRGHGTVGDLADELELDAVLRHCRAKLAVLQS